MHVNIYIPICLPIRVKLCVHFCSSNAHHRTSSHKYLSGYMTANKHTSLHIAHTHTHRTSNLCMFFCVCVVVNHRIASAKHQHLKSNLRIYIATPFIYLMMVLGRRSFCALLLLPEARAFPELPDPRRCA